MPDDKPLPVVFYATHNEVTFLRELGTYGKAQRDSQASLLRQYLAAMRLRQEWGQIDRSVVEREARKLLAQAEREA